jgi:hypothetical protein
MRDVQSVDKGLTKERERHGKNGKHLTKAPVQLRLEFT